MDEAPPIMPHRAPDLRPSRRGRGALAAAASILLVGLGHVLAKRRQRALFWFIPSAIFYIIYSAAFIFPSLLPVLIVMVPLTLLWNLSSLIDAYRVGRTAEYP